MQTFSLATKRTLSLAVKLHGNEGKSSFAGSTFRKASAVLEMSLLSQRATRASRSLEATPPAR